MGIYIEIYDKKNHRFFGKYILEGVISYNKKMDPDLAKNYNSAMKVQDACMMLKRTIPVNVSPYTRLVLTHNNRLVDRWCEEVLLPLSNIDGTVPSGRVWKSWEVFRDGIDYDSFMENVENFPSIPDELLKEWVDLFKIYNIDELSTLGSGVVNYGWGIVQYHMKREYLIAKKEIFGEHTTPIERENISVKFVKLLSGRVDILFDTVELDEISEKLKVIHRNPIEATTAGSCKTIAEFRTMHLRKIPRNIDPYTECVLKTNNLEIEKFCGVLDKVDLDVLDFHDIRELWEIYKDGIEIMKLHSLGGVYTLPENIVAFWKDFFEHNSLEKMLGEMSTGMIGVGWSMIINHIKTTFIKEKFSSFYNIHSPVEWIRNSGEFRGVFVGMNLKNVFWTKDVFNSIAEKVGTILKLPVSVQALGPGC